MRVMPQHLRFMKPRYCVTGSRAFFERYGLDWKEFIKEGIDENELLNTGDPMAIALVEEARKHGRK